MSSGAGGRQRKSRLEQIQLRLRQQIHEEHRNQFSALEERKRLLQKERQQVNQQRRAIDSLRKKSLQSRENSITVAGELSRSRSASEKLLRPNIRYRGHRVPPLQEERRSAPLRERAKPDVSPDPRALSASRLHDRDPDSPDDSRRSSANVKKKRHPLAQTNRLEPQTPASSTGDAVTEVEEESSPEGNPMQHSAEDAFSQFEEQAEKQRRLKQQEAERQEKEQEKQRAKEVKKRRKKLEELKRRQDERQQRMKERSKAHDIDRQRNKQQQEQDMEQEHGDMRQQPAGNGAKGAAAPAFDEQPLPTHRAASTEATPRKRQNRLPQPVGQNNDSPSVETIHSTPDTASDSSRASSSQHAPRPPASQNPSRGQRRYGRGAGSAKTGRPSKQARPPPAQHEQQQQQQQQKAKEKRERAKPRAPPGEPIRQQVEELMPDGSVQMIELILYPCSICGRNFKEERLEAHKRACEANSKKKRKKFDMTKQRLNDLGHDAIVLAKKADKTEKKYKKKARKGNWRAKHEQFIAAIKSAKGADVEVPTVEDPDLVKCKICGRTFHEDAARRHTPVCERNAKKAAMNKGRGGAKARGRGRR